MNILINKDTGLLSGSSVYSGQLIEVSACEVRWKNCPGIYCCCFFNPSRVQRHCRNKSAEEIVKFQLDCSSVTRTCRQHRGWTRSLCRVVMSKSAAVKREAFSRPLAGGENQLAPKCGNFMELGTICWDQTTSQNHNIT